MKDKISVIIPTYNREKHIEKSVRSVLDQTYTNIEVIVVDDHSVDQTEKVIKKIKDERLKYIKLRKNAGACHTRNVGIEHATGSYIAFQDSDDVFKKDKLEKQLKHLKECKSDLDFCKLEDVTYEKSYIFPTKKQEENLQNKTILEELCNGNLISTQTILAKKKVFEDVKFDETLPRFQDYDLVLRIASKYKISYTKEILVDVYKYSDSISASDEKMKIACVKMLNKDYHLNGDLQKSLRKTLLFWANQKEMTELQEEATKIWLEYKQLQENYEQLKKEYDTIVNSRRWKYTNKVLRAFKK